MSKCYEHVGVFRRECELKEENQRLREALSAIRGLAIDGEGGIVLSESGRLFAIEMAALAGLSEPGQAMRVGQEPSAESSAPGRVAPPMSQPPGSESSDTDPLWCPKCGGDAGDNYFDRSFCPCEPGLGVMHTRCRTCGYALDGCGFDKAEEPAEELARLRVLVAQPELRELLEFRERCVGNWDLKVNAALRAVVDAGLLQQPQESE